MAVYRMRGTTFIVQARTLSRGRDHRYPAILRIRTAGHKPYAEQFPLNFPARSSHAMLLHGD